MRAENSTLELLNKYRVVLASGSPRRKELLQSLGLKFEVEVKKDISENYPTDLPAEKISEYVSREKAEAYEVAEGELLITADTTVVLDGEALGKPCDADEAKAMLRKLSGRKHLVVTGVTLTTVGRQRSFSAVTEVEFDTLDEAEIDYYVDTFKPLDKAGAYGIQEWIGCAAVKGISGSFYNVMGLPVQRLYAELKAFIRQERCRCRL